MNEPVADLDRVSFTESSATGHVDLSGPTLELLESLDREFCRWAGKSGAQAYRFPGLIAARHLARVNYFQSFPHLATFPVSHREHSDSLNTIAAVDDGGPIPLGELEPVEHVLTPAACYHFYPLLEDEVLDAPRFLTTCCQCYRHETFYRPLERQWQFAMREIVCVGSAQEVQAFLDDYQRIVKGFAETLGIPLRYAPATDPFFRPQSNPKALAQRVDPVKTEMLFGSLAIGSFNSHRNFFGEAFNIRRGADTAFSGCVAFGLERWLLAFLATHGSDPQRWPLDWAGAKGGW